LIAGLIRVNVAMIITTDIQPAFGSNRPPERMSGTGTDVFEKIKSSPVSIRIDRSTK
jgi:hypothetical protein